MKDNLTTLRSEFQELEAGNEALRQRWNASDDHEERVELSQQIAENDLLKQEKAEQIGEALFGG